ncbi:hypothetical protein SDJN02_25200, partial [Cucurbita argyrosperma subsp. argyrosperma]
MAASNLIEDRVMDPSGSTTVQIVAPFVRKANSCTLVSVGFSGGLLSDPPAKVEFRAPVSHIVCQAPLSPPFVGLTSSSSRLITRRLPRYQISLIRRLTFHTLLIPNISAYLSRRLPADHG